MTEARNILIKNIFHMLSYAFKELKKNNFTSVSKEKFDNTQDLFAELLYRGVSLQLKQGLHRNYIEKVDNLTTLRGKLKIADTLKLKSIGIQKLNCEFDEFSINNIFNQVVATTLRLLVNHPNTKTERKSKIKKVIPFFSEVDSIDLRHIRWQHLRFDRNSKSYQLLLYLCYFIANDFLFSQEKGTYKHLAVTDAQRMNRLFEKFVLEYYRFHYPDLKASPRQIEWNIDSEKSSAICFLPILQTDIMLTFPERTLIIDAKFYGETLQTHYDKKTIHSNNQNQIFTYVMNHDKEGTGKTDGMLLYAKTNEEIHPDGHITYTKGNKTYYRTLDLYQDFENIKRQLDSIVEIYF